MMSHNKSKTDAGEQLPLPLPQSKKTDALIENLGCTQAQLAALLRLVDKPLRATKRGY